MEPYDFTAGRSPLLVSMPHVGTYVPDAIQAQFSEEAMGLPDTDWFVDRLYSFLDELGASVIRANYSRYVIDLNRAPDSAPLYPGADNTELCPTTTFAGDSIYKYRLPLEPEEIDKRRFDVWHPYHAQIKSELAAIKARHGIALLWDAHSIKSRVPRFFDGILPDLNLGTGGGATAEAELIRRVANVARDAEGFDHVVDGRFKGGYITRAYGRPEDGCHAIQLEIGQRCYMSDKPPFGLDQASANKLRPVLRLMLETAISWAESAVEPA